MSAPPSPGLQRFLVAVGEALRRGDIAGAMSLSDQAVGMGLESPDILVLAGQYRMRQGRSDLDGEGVGQWRRFAPQLEPILPILAPWVARFGYPEA